MSEPLLRLPIELWEYILLQLIPWETLQLKTVKSSVSVAWDANQLRD